MYQNRVSIIGFVGNDAQLRSTNKGAPVAVFSVATKSSWKNVSGGYDSRTEWHRCVAWGSLSQFAAKLGKGAHVQVEGELRYREYEKEYGTKKAPAPVGSPRSTSTVSSNSTALRNRTSLLPRSIPPNFPPTSPPLRGGPFFGVPSMPRSGTPR